MTSFLRIARAAATIAILAAPVLALPRAAHAQAAPTGALTATALTLPAGPGSVAGLAQSADLDLFSGQISYAVPLKVPSVRGMSPSLALAYSGALGNGPAGIGWSFATPAIRRSLHEGVPRYDDRDELTIDGIASGRLVRIAADEYRVEGAGNGVRVRRIGDRFEVTDGNGTRYVMGQSWNARQKDGARIAAWFVEAIIDLAGDALYFDYTQDRGEVYLHAASWGPGGRFRVEVELEDRADVVTSFATGFEVTTARRLKSIRATVKLPGKSAEELSRYVLGYDARAGLSRLVSVTVTGRGGGGELPVIGLGYSAAHPTRRWRVDTGGWMLGARGVGLLDVDGDGVDDLIRLAPGATAWRKNLGGHFDAERAFASADALELDAVGFVDLDGDARPEVLRRVDDQWRAASLIFEGGVRGLGDAVAVDGSRGVSLGGGGSVLADLDGDGRTDVVDAVTGGLRVRRGTAFGLGPAVYVPPISPVDPNVAPGAGDVRFLDANSDGLADAVWLTDSWMKVFLGRGDGSFLPYAKVFYPWGTGAVSLDHVHLVDLDRNGLLDLVRVDAGQLRWYAGQGGFRFASLPVLLERPAGADSDARVSFADVDGNGSVEVVWSTPDGMWALDFAGGTDASMLASIDDGMGTVTHLGYGTSGQLSLASEAAGQPWSRTLPRSMAVITEKRTTYADGAPDMVAFAGVRDGFWDGAERRFGGFLMARTVLPGITATDLRIEETRFEEGVGADRVVRGRVAEARTLDGLGHLFSVETTGWGSMLPHSLLTALDPADPLLRVAVATSSRHDNHEGVTSPLSNLTETSYDAEGRPFEVRKYGRTDVVGDEAIAQTFYASDDTTWVRDRVIEEKLLTGDRHLVADTRHYFGDADRELPLGSIGFGWSRRDEGLVWSDGATPSPPRWVTLSTTGYDRAGNVVETTKGAPGVGVTKHYQFDDDKLYPVRETVAPAPGQELAWIAEWDRVLGSVSRVVEPTGDSTTVSHDELGRITAVARNQLPPHERYTYEWTAPRPRTHTFVFDGDPATLPQLGGAWRDGKPWRETVAVADSGGAELYTAIRLGPARWAITGWAVRDGRARITDVIGAFEHAGAALPITPPADLPRQQLRYDALDRVREQLLPGGSRRVTTYRAYEQTVTADGLAPTSSRVDGLDRIVHTERQVGAVLESIDADYDVAGRITGFHLQRGDGPAHPVHRFVYDSLGRIVEADDPDVGLRTVSYDDAGRPHRQVNGAGQGMTYGYDGAGRLISRVGDDGTGFAYHYDRPRQGSDPRDAARLAWVEEPTGTVDLVYDAFARTRKVSRVVDGTTLARTMVASASGLALRDSYVSDYDVGYVYDAAGRLTGVTGNGADLWSVLDFEPGGRITRERYGNGVVTETGYDLTGQSRHLDIKRSAQGASLYAIDLARNEWGAVTHVTDLDGVGLDHTASFGYDGAGRLTSAVLGTAPAMGQPDPRFSFSYGYDGLQNMVTREATAPRATGQYLGRYCYGQDGGGPRQLTSVMPMTGGACPSSPAPSALARFTYDDAGRQLTDGDRRLTWDGLDQLAAVDLPGGLHVDHAYGYDGQRVRTRDNQGGATEYWFGQDMRMVGGVIEQYVKIGDRIVAKVQLSQAGSSRGAAAATVATPAIGAPPRPLIAAMLAALALSLAALVARTRGRALAPALAPILATVLLMPGCGALFGSSERPLWSATKVTYLHAGFGEGPALLTSDRAKVVEERRYEPFGQDLDAYHEDGGLFDRVDYALEPFNGLNKPTDPHTGWSYHGARWMAPQTARWLSPDPPVKAPDPSFMDRPWSLHPYQYVEQNPVLFWDPDGRETKQQAWEREFEQRYGRYKGAGNVAGERDDGIMTPSGMRVPAVKGHMLNPRPFYENKRAAFMAWQGYVHIAEFYEAHHEPALTAITLHWIETFGGQGLIFDNQLDLAHELQWSYEAISDRTAVEFLVLAGTTSETFEALLERGVGCPMCPCFLAGTQVELADGTTRAIEDIEPGDVVMADDPLDAEGPRAATVLEVHRNWTEHVVTVHVHGADGEGLIEATREHPFWTRQGWIAARALRPGDLLVDDRDDDVAVTAVTLDDRRADTFNLSIEDVSTYFVVTHGVSVLVHNVPPAKGAVPPVPMIRASCPIEIPPSVPDGVVELKNSGFYQVKWEYTDLKGMSWEVRWHTTTPGAAAAGDSRYASWVVERVYTAPNGTEIDEVLRSDGAWMNSKAHYKGKTGASTHLDPNVSVTPCN